MLAEKRVGWKCSRVQRNRRQPSLLWLLLQWLRFFCSGKQNLLHLWLWKEAQALPVAHQRKYSLYLPSCEINQNCLVQGWVQRGGQLLFGCSWVWWWWAGAALLTGLVYFCQWFCSDWNPKKPSFGWRRLFEGCYWGLHLIVGFKIPLTVTFQEGALLQWELCALPTPAGVCRGVQPRGEKRGELQSPFWG